MPLTVTSAGAHELPLALRALFAHGEHPELAAKRLLALFADGTLDPRGLIVAKRSDAIVGAILAYRIGGAQAALWLPVAEEDATRDALVAGALDWIRQEPAKVIQALIREPERPRADVLLRAGFRSVTRLAYLSRPCAPADAAFQSPRLRFQPMPLDTECVALLLRTYEGTRDVPELNGTRTPGEVLDGYRTPAAGALEPYAILSAGAAVGLVILAPAPDDPTLELTYVGLVPSARNFGFGREAVDFALARAAALARHSVLLNVDVRNEPALRIYRERKFRTDDLRDVYLRLPE